MHSHSTHSFKVHGPKRLRTSWRLENRLSAIWMYSRSLDNIRDKILSLGVSLTSSKILGAKQTIDNMYKYCSLSINKTGRAEVMWKLYIYT